MSFLRRIESFSSNSLGYLLEDTVQENSSNNSRSSSGISSSKGQLLQEVLPKRGKEEMRLEQLDKPLLTDRMDKFTITNEKDVETFLGDVEKRIPEFNGIHWGEFAKKIHSIKDPLLVSSKERIQRIASSIFQCKDLTAGQVAQLTGSVFPLCDSDHNFFTQFLVLFSQHISKFTKHECLIALKGIRKITNGSQFVFDILNHLQKEDKNEAAGSILLTFSQCDKFSVTQLANLFPNKFTDLNPKEQLNFLKGILSFAKKGVFFKTSMPYLNVQHFHRLREEPVFKNIAKRILLGLEIALQYSFITIQWENLFLNYETKFSLLQKIAFFQLLLRNKKQLGPELKKSFETLKEEANKISFLSSDLSTLVTYL